MSRRSQLSFFRNKSIYASWKQLGGSQLKSHPKRRRPISTKDEIHVVLKSRLSNGKLSMRMPKNLEYIKKQTYNTAARFRIKIARYENVGNHLHLLIRVPSHKNYNAFIRGISSSIARHVLQISKSRTYGDITKLASSADASLQPKVSLQLEVSLQPKAFSRPTPARQTPNDSSKNLQQDKRFWESRPFTRIVTFGRDRNGLLRYLNFNRVQAIGFSVFVKEQELGYLLSG